MIPYSQLEQLLQTFPDLHIGIVGDFCVDVYLDIDTSASEISVETGLPTQPVKEQRYSLGGAANVAANLAKMGIGQIQTFGVVGHDPYADVLKKLLTETGISATNLQTQVKWDTHVFTKIIANEQEQPRLDFGNFNQLAALTQEHLLKDLARCLPQLNILIINQQVLLGLHTASFRRDLVGLLAKSPRLPVVTDSRQYSDDFTGSMRKINAHEGALLCGKEIALTEEVPGETVRKIAAKLYKRWGQPVFISRGGFGSVVVDKNGQYDLPGLSILSPIDTVGAGDSLLAGIAAALAAGQSAPRAAEFGTLVAGVTIQKRFITGTATPAELLALGKDPDYRYAPDLAARPHLARFHEDTEIELINPWPKRPGIAHAIFDHDGTISTLRQGWEEVMEPMMITAILGDTPADPLFTQRVQTRVRDFIDKTTGIQTLVQMKGLCRMVAEFGCVPPDQILDEHGYKAIFNTALMGRVDKRLEKLDRGELDIVDFTVKNALAFLEALSARGIRLYLASGSDDEDVKREAGRQGYDHFFEGRIYGSLNDIDHEPKKKVLEMILGDIENSGSGDIITFGDGPVEIRETRKRGGLTCGVASNEIRRYGIDQTKRSRLIQAGADVIIPDFSQMDRLLALVP